MSLPALVLMVAVFFGAAQAAQNYTHSADFRSMQQKVEYLRHNAARPHPDPKPTELTEAEANAYFKEGGVKLPKGVSNVRLASQPGMIDGHAQIDFEAIMEGKGSTNPLLALFSGAHDVHLIAQAGGSGGTGTIRVQSAYIDGIEIPQMALQLFARYYLTPKYPNVGVTSTFRLPLRIDSAAVEAGAVRLMQK